MAFNFITHRPGLPELAVLRHRRRPDRQPFRRRRGAFLQGVQRRRSPTFSSFVPFTHFRPAFTTYPKLSNEIQVITGQVMTGQATPAQGVANYNKYLVSLVGKSDDPKQHRRKPEERPPRALRVTVEADPVRM